MLKFPSMRVLSIAFVVAICVVFLAVFLVDDPVARFVSRLPWSGAIHSKALGSPVLVIISGLTIVAGGFQATSGRPLSRLMQTMVIASFSLVWSVCIDEFVLKYVFGRDAPAQFLETGFDVFHWFQGAQNASFPSGHAVQLASVGSVFVLAYPKRWPIWCAFTCVGLVALVLGNWHFVSDVVAGAAIGIIGGIATFKLWQRAFLN